MRLDPKSAGMSCTGCGSTDYFYNCPPCKTPIRVAQSLVGKKVKCPKCDKSTDWGKWAKSQSSANAFATHPDESFFLDDHDRRVVGGTIIVQTGFSPFSDGSTCTLEFGKDRVSIIAPANGSGPRPRPIQLSYAEVTGLEIGGVGRTQTTVKARSGRLRETLVEGTLIATGLHETLGGFLVEAVTDATGEKSKTTTSVETKVTLSAGPRACPSPQKPDTRGAPCAVCAGLPKNPSGKSTANFCRDDASTSTTTTSAVGVGIASTTTTSAVGVGIASTSTAAVVVGTTSTSTAATTAPGIVNTAPSTRFMDTRTCAFDLRARHASGQTQRPWGIARQTECSPKRSSLPRRLAF